MPNDQFAPLTVNGDSAVPRSGIASGELLRKVDVGPKGRGELSWKGTSNARLLELLTWRLKLKLVPYVKRGVVLIRNGIEEGAEAPGARSGKTRAAGSTTIFEAEVLSTAVMPVTTSL